MEETEFIVREESMGGSLPSDTYSIYFEFLHGKNAGQRLQIPLREHDPHGSGVLEQLKELQPEDVVTAKLKPYEMSNYVVLDVEKIS